MFLDAIDAVDWSAIPNPTGHRHDDPERVGQALRLLAVSTTANETGDAAATLAGSGFVRGHAAMVFPAAYAAAPILLDLVEDGHRLGIKGAAIGLLSQALSCYPAAGHCRVDTPSGASVPICCAIAGRIRAGSSALLAFGVHGKQLLAEADLHWRLTINEIEQRPGSNLIAVATLEGAPVQTPVEAEAHTPPFGQPGPNLWINTLVAEASGSAYIELRNPSPQLTPGSTLYPADCARREH
ncbi:hypothetical protein AB0M29_37760 [Streptomyces sp. NPDC051976]|uniref:hypothetical protein n=1 Tax=Streptomyces sp. NPDC051976 TaxID=3154947 RepID=UPI00344397B0